MSVPGSKSSDGSTTFSYLEFGAIDPVGGVKTVWDFRTGQTAYDWFMLARYANDLAAYQRMMRLVSDDFCPDELEAAYRCDIHHTDDFSVNLGKLLALAAVSGNSDSLSFFELGQTLFGCIEGMELCNALLERCPVSWSALDLRQVAWTGVDISPLFNQLAPLLHAGYSVTTHDSTSLLESHYNVFFAKGVTLLYAVRTVDELFSLLTRSDLALFDYSLSLGEEQQVVIGTGKPAVYLPLADFLAACQSAGGQLYIKRGNSRIDPAVGRIWLDAVYGGNDLCRSFTDLDSEVRSALGENLGKQVSDSLLDQADGRNSGWVTLGQFLGEHGFSVQG